MSIALSDIRGFNYSGSWGTSGLDLWQHHDHGTMAVEIARGKRYFPKWNVVRWWLSDESFRRSPERFLANFEAGLDLFASNQLLVMPVLFNRWRDPACDFGGVSIEHILPGASFCCDEQDFDSVDRSGAPFSIQHLFGAYLRAVIGSHGSDDRIFAWDICNEPLLGPYALDPDNPMRLAELKWLRWCRDACRAFGAGQPLTIGNHGNPAIIEATEPLSDFISFHPYYIPSDSQPDSELSFDFFSSKEGFEAALDSVLEHAKRAGKEVIASETVWGAVDDQEHVEQIRYTLPQLTARKIGFIAHALHHSLVADLHSEGFGPVSSPGRLEFINADGTLREGHDAINEF